MGTQIVSATATDASNNVSQSTTYTVAVEYVSTSITKRWIDPLTTSHPATTVQLQQGTTLFREVSVPAGSITEAGDTFIVEQLPRYAADATEHVYTVAEAPPTGYTATVTGSRTDGFVVTNTRIVATAILHKTTPEGAGIEGADYELFTAAGVSLGTATTDSNGQARFPGLPTGDYYLQETKAPAGYRLATAPQPFSVTESGEIPINVVDHRIADMFPVTGTLGELPFQIAGGVLIFGAAFFGWRRRQRSKDFRASSPDEVTQPLTTLTKEP